MAHDYSALFRRAIDVWGERPQVLMLAEEASELAVAALHFLRGRPGSIDGLAEEIADVEIMCAQIRTIVGDEWVDKHRRLKLERLRGRLEGRD